MSPVSQPPELIGQSQAFLDALARVSSAASLERPVLVVGERGSGKELFAERLHFLSPRWQGPYVKVNCAALSEDLLDSDLFGHEPGAFTGAQRRHVGRFERAEGGTLFLDEIASASDRVQEKLLRVIEYGEYERLGGEKTLIANVRVVAAANIDLRAAADRGGFRADLLDRLAFDVITAPPLRARAGDVPVLAAHFASLMAAELGVGFPGFTQNAMGALLAHSWPGNVRELKNVAERSLYRWLSAGQTGPVADVIIDPFDSPHAPPPHLATMGAVGADMDTAIETRTMPSMWLETKGGPTPAPDVIDLRRQLDAIEKQAVSDALDRAEGNQKRAAQRLSLTYDQMRGLVRKHGLSGSRQDNAAGDRTAKSAPARSD